MTVSFPIDDLRKSLPGADNLAGLSGEAQVAELRRLLGRLAEGAGITVDESIVTLEFGDVPSASATEAERLYHKPVRTPIL